MTSFVVAKFGGTSVADYAAMNRSADVVLADQPARRTCWFLCLKDWKRPSVS